MPMRSGAMQRPRVCRCGNTLRQRYDEVGLPCSSTMGSPSPTSTYAISLPRTPRRCFWYGNAAEIMIGSPFFVPSTPIPKGRSPSRLTPLKRCGGLLLLRPRSLFCGDRVSSALEIGGIHEPLAIFTVSFQHTLTTCWIHIKLRCHLAALLEFR